MKVLITGSSGFIGSYLVKELSGHDITGIDTRDSRDARDYFRQDSHPHFDLVVHCAAVVGGRELIETQMAHAANLEIDAALFGWAERAEPGRVVYISSVSAYPGYLQQGAHEIYPGVTIPATTLEEGHIRLHSLLGFPDELYGWAKLTGEILASRSSIPVSVVRPFTVYGEGQDPVFPFANIAAQFRQHRDPVTVWGSGNQVRDFIHVSDVAKAIITMAGKGIPGPVNLCTGRAVSLRDLTGLFAEQAGYAPDIKLIDKPEGLVRRVGNPDRMHEFYTPQVSLEEGVRKALKGP